MAVWLVISWLALPGTQARAVDAEAVAGRPFGVARVTLPPQADWTEAVELNQATISEATGRVFYPVFSTGKVRKVLGDLLGFEGEGPTSVTVLFLFRGDEPLRLSIDGPQTQRIDLVPRPLPPRNQQRLVDRWWREYNAVARQQADDGDFSPIASTYLTTMLQRRMNLPPANNGKPLAGVTGALGGGVLAGGGGRNSTSLPDEVRESFELLLGLEKLRMTTLRDSMLSSTDGAERAELPLPRDIAWAPPRPVEFDPDVAVEPIARRVPEECFYIRFGKFSNYMWLYKLMREYGGEIGSMVTLRGVRGPGDQRVQQQLSLPPPNSPLAELLGETVISDVALIGRDLYLDDGAAIGVLFQVRTGLFATNLNQQRQATLAKEKDRGATLETVRIGGRDVSFLSTPDNRVRSFYVADGDYHLVTTSRAIVERFLEAGQGRRALADSPEFKHARTRLPLDRNDTIFVYLSPAFFRGLLAPQYQVEVGRRLRSLTDMQLMQLARLAARNESLRDDWESLIASGLLPRGFGRRPDGSGPLDDDFAQVDSLRGARGTFTPVPDVPVTAVTRREADDCWRRSEYYEQNWKQLDPVLIGVKRTPLEGGAERIEIDGRISPLDESKYGRWLSILGPPARQRVTPAREDVVTVQVIARGGGFDPSIPPHHLFLGIQDSFPLAENRGGNLIKTLRLLQTTPGYLGAWPKPGYLDSLPLGLGGGRPDPAGYSRLLFGLWRRQWGDFSALAFDPSVLERVAPQLAIEPTDDPAQIRVHVGDLSRAKFSVWVNKLTYERARQASQGNLKLLGALTQQFDVPPVAARDVAQRLLGAELVCTLGGKYELISAVGGARQPVWRSTKDRAPRDERVPDGYQAPLLTWFRGLDSGLIKHPDHVHVSATLDMLRPSNSPRLVEVDPAPADPLPAPAGRAPAADDDAKPDGAGNGGAKGGASGFGNPGAALLELF
ncbi:MAG TPA: hypothetical protein PLV92_00400, partial [Pirellulaceae bacterium]|nr:hypothetical protein [Pirellulaceae bacterium]